MCSFKDNCFIFKLLELDENDMPMELTNYENYRNLDNAKTRSLIDFCELLSPDNLEGRCIFQTDDLDGASNREMELSMAQSTMDLTTSSITIAGRNAQITTVMLYTRSWRRNNYDEPMAELARARNNSSCILSSCILL